MTVEVSSLGTNSLCKELRLSITRVDEEDIVFNINTYIYMYIYLTRYQVSTIRTVVDTVENYIISHKARHV